MPNLDTILHLGNSAGMLIFWASCCADILIKINKPDSMWFVPSVDSKCLSPHLVWQVLATNSITCVTVNNMSCERDSDRGRRTGGGGGEISSGGHVERKHHAPGET